MKMNNGIVALEINKDNFGKVKIPTISGDIVLQIDTGFEAAHYYTQYSKVVAVADNETEIKVGMYVFHNHNVYSDSRFIDKDVYWTPREFVFGTSEQMFGDYVMVEKIYEKKDAAVGLMGVNARIEQITEALKNKCKVLTGKYKGKVMYCTNVMFYEIVGYDPKICIAKENQLVADEEFNPCENKVLIKANEDDFIKRDSGIIVTKMMGKPKCKTGIVVKSNNKDILGTNVVYNKYYQLTIDNVVHHVVEEKNVEAYIA